ncbi:hypothetical protein GW17_00024779 [Ensete ventricosum]|nr:hypothetical protein GW17_00024779 [Ensete ventricosum]
MDQHPQHIRCKHGTPHYVTDNASNPNVLVGALVDGGPNNRSGNILNFRPWSNQSGPATYSNAPWVYWLASADTDDSFVKIQYHTFFAK